MERNPGSWTHATPPRCRSTASSPTSTYGQSITFTAMVTPTGGGPTPTGSVQFVVDGSNFGSVVDLVNGAATSTSLSSLDAGPHTILVTYSGDTNYVPVTSASFKQTVSKAHLTVTADSKTKVYGDPVPVLTASITGFVNGDKARVVTGSPTVTSAASSASGVGSYAISVSVGTLAAANYDFPNLANGTLTVTKAHLTVTADPKTKAYDAALPAFTYQITGFVNGDTPSVITGAPSVSTTANAASDAGTYPISVADGTMSAVNYDFPVANLVASTLTVTPAPLTITVDPKTRVYGQTNPILTGTVSGILNNDPVTVDYTTTATPADGVVTGGYPITVGSLSGPKGSDYSITVAGAGVTSAVLTITRASLTVTADSKSKAYGAALPALTYQITGFVNGDTMARSPAHRA